MADFENIVPSKDPANDDTLSGVLSTVIKKHLQNIDGQLPAQVISYDRATNRATVQPLITRLTTDGQPFERGVISSVPVVALGGGGFYLNFPLVAGDRGWIEASDRDISLFMQGDTMAKPNTLRLHSFSDGRFVPDIMGSYDYDAGDDGKLVIASKDGQTKITLSPDTIQMKAQKVDIQGDVVTINGVEITPDSHITAAGASLDGIEFADHIHDAPGGPTGTPHL